jgi:hypothetical protein
MSDDGFGPGAPPVASFVVKHRAGSSYPRVACAGCGALIVEMAGVVWSPDPLVEEGVSPITVLCKANHCLARDPRWRDWAWEELGDYLVWVLQNTGAHPAQKFRRLVADADRAAELT